MFSAYKYFFSPSHLLTKSNVVFHVEKDNKTFLFIETHYIFLNRIRRAVFIILEFVVNIIMKPSSFCNLYHAKFIFKSSTFEKLKELPCKYNK